MANFIVKYISHTALPISGYEWMSREELDSFDYTTPPSDDNEEGHAFMVTLDYPASLHVKHAQFPLAPESLQIGYNMLSSASKVAYREQRKLPKNAKFPYSSKKLVGTFGRKVNYVVSGSNLQYYLNKGLILKQVHKGIRYRQSKFLADYINHCSALRRAATSAFKKRLIKYFANSIYGKMLQNTQKYVEVKIITSRRRLLKVLSSPRLVHFSILSEECVLVFLRKPSVILDRPYAVGTYTLVFRFYIGLVKSSWDWYAALCYTYVSTFSAGFTILEHSKETMFRAFYDKIQPAFGDDVQVGMSDTDSFVLRARGSSPEELLSRLGAPFMDFSNYHKKSPLYSELVKGIPGMLLERLGKPMILHGLRGDRV
jgi:hypothetical protein